MADVPKGNNTKVMIDKECYDELCSRVRHLNTAYKSVQRRTHKEIEVRIEALEHILSNLRIIEKKNKWYSFFKK